MKKILLLLFLSVAFCFYAPAQGLVINPGFETITAIPTSEGQILLAPPWQSPGGGTPDLFNTGYTGIALTWCDSVGIPFNAGGYAPALSGNSYAGISIDLANGYYEYLQVPLGVPMQAGEYYKVNMDILLADSSQFSCDRIGVLLSTNTFAQTGTGIMPFTPQWETGPNVLLNDTGAWMKPQFFPAVYQSSGGENYITVGIFRDAVSLNIQDNGVKNSNCINYDRRVYYYIDNVTVEPTNELVILAAGDTSICPNESTVLIAQSNVQFTWSDEFNPNDTLTNVVEYIVTPSVTTTYYLNGPTITDSITIYVVNPPSFDLGNDTTFCEGDTVALNATSSDAILYTWSTGDTIPISAATDTGLYWVIVDNIGCGVFDSIYFYEKLPNPAIDLGLDSMYCFFDNDTLFLDAGANSVSYKWIPFGDTTQVVKVIASAYYQVTALRENGCIRRAGFEVLELCEPKIFIPSGFTPDGDGLNDVFLPAVNNVTLYSLQVYSRTGKLLFSNGNQAIGWDGKYNGKEMPAGVYTYRLYFGGFDSEGEKKLGKYIDTIYLLR